MNPWALKPKTFFFGLLYVDAWIYRCVLSCAKIEIMCADLPRVEYSKTDKDGNVIKKSNASDDKKVVDLNRALVAKNKAMQAEPAYAGEKISLTNLLEGK